MKAYKQQQSTGKGSRSEGGGNSNRDWQVAFHICSATTAPELFTSSYRLPNVDRGQGS